MSERALFKRTRTIEDEHVDQLGHVNNVVWINLAIDLAVAHAGSVGMDFETTKKLGGIWIVRRHEIDYHQPALPGEEVLEETWISSLRGARSVRNARFTRVKDGARLVSAVTQWAYVDVRTQRPRRIDPEILEAFEVLETAH